MSDEVVHVRRERAEADEILAGAPVAQGEWGVRALGLPRVSRLPRSGAGRSRSRG
ncbi:hypothetical protein PV726_48205 [Streptomyces europaeiscabiei]|uniref:hypothetical protein n=1 Tax=Streptomyces europaeiscabiei TaxID=146819 RepID=UPI0029AECC81|nr:hypothetical protein [Streptomyces europaeiscabiei]MDX3697816.1 hypothetical protein [Streptomyces europaeiscabiei]